MPDRRFELHRPLQSLFQKIWPFLGDGIYFNRTGKTKLVSQVEELEVELYKKLIARLQCYLLE